MATEPVYTPIPWCNEHEGMLVGSIFLPENLEKCKHFELATEDVLMSGYPKSGTTWLQEVVWLLRNDVDVARANSESTWLRTPLIESAPPNEPSGLEIVDKQAHPRIIKTHLPVKYWRQQIQDSKPKVIVMMRNPNDVLVSFYHFIQLGHGKGCISWDQWFDNLRCGKMFYGTWLDHVHDWWVEFKDCPNFLFLKFEDMKADKAKCVKEVASFLEKDLTDEQLNAILEHTSFKKMKENPATNLKEHKYLNQNEDGATFQRKGEVGDWRNHFKVEQAEWLEKAVADKLGGTDLEFKYD